MTKAFWVNTLSLDKNQKYMCLDIETTSLKPENEGVLEVYVAIIQNGEVIESHHSLHYHENYKNTQHIHKIADEELLGQAPFEESEMKDILATMFKKCLGENNKMTFMAQYAAFEISWMEEKLGMDLSDMRVYDTRLAERHLLDDESIPAGLIAICNRRGIKSPNGKDFHRAQWDVEAMIKVYNQQIKELYEKGYKDGEVINVTNADSIKR